MEKKMNRLKEKFTLIELLVVIAIIVIDVIYVIDMKLFSAKVGFRPCSSINFFSCASICPRRFEKTSITSPETPSISNQTILPLSSR